MPSSSAARACSAWRWGWCCTSAPTCALGTLFLTLDVVANLVHAGLRDHRVGFLVMTLTGLTIVSGRVLATLKRQQLELWMRRVRVELRGWD